MRPPLTPAPMTGLSASTPVFLAVGLIVLGVFAALASRTAPHPERTAEVGQSLDARFGPAGVTFERAPGQTADILLRRLADAAGLALTLEDGRSGLVLAHDDFFLTGTLAVSPEGEGRIAAIAAAPVWQGWAAVVEAPAADSAAAAALRDRLVAAGLPHTAMIVRRDATAFALRLAPAGALP